MRSVPLLILLVIACLLAVVGVAAIATPSEVFVASNVVSSEGSVSSGCFLLNSPGGEAPNCGLAVSPTLVPGTAIEQGGVLTIRLLLTNTLGEPNEGRVSVTNEPLGIDVSTRYSLDVGGHATIDFIVPLRCTEPGTQILTITTERQEGAAIHAQRQFQRLHITEGDCTPGSRADLLLETVTQQTVEAGETAYFPFRIVNLRSEAQSLRFVLEGLPAGTYRVEPQAASTLPPGGALQGMIVIDTAAETAPGKHQLTLIAGSEHAPLTLRIIQRVPAQSFATVLLRAVHIALVLFVLALILAALILLYRHMRGEKKEDTDFGDYY